MTRLMLALWLACCAFAMGSGAASAATNDDDWFGGSVRAQHHSATRSAHHSSRRMHRTVAHKRPRAHHVRVAASEPRPSHRRHASLPSLTGSRGHMGGGYTGMASFYSEPQALASGGRFNPRAMTAAHKTLPFGTRVRVTNLNNGRVATVTINDRGPYVGGRVIDLSAAAASAVGMISSGVARVKLDILR